MFSTLDLDILPGIGLGMFELGTSFWDVIENLRSLTHIYPQVEVKYDPDSSTTTPIVLHIRPHLDLLFTSKHQRLHTICVRKLRDAHPPVTLRYSNAVLCSPEEPLTRLAVTRSFGPTYPGPGEDIRYPGVWFSFDDGQMIESKPSDYKHQEVKRVQISQREVSDALDEVIECPAMEADISLAVVKLHFGVILHFFSSVQPIAIRINQSTAQDLTLDLGQPDRIHYKEDARMTIHTLNTGSDDEQDTGYFYNYFRLGMDFLISSNTHLVKKVILHTNIPGTPLFQTYKRCPWELESEPEDDEDDTPPRKRFYDRFETISHFLSPREPPPSMLLDRTDEEENLTLPNPTTRLYGYDGIVLEVTESSQVATVMLF